MVLAILSLITFIALPVINESRKNAQIELLKSEMTTRLFDLQNYISEKESINNSYAVVGAQYYNSPYFINSSELQSIINDIYSDFPLYLAAEIECNEDSSGEFLKISISYPGNGSNSQSITRLKNIHERELAQGYYGEDNTLEAFNDLSGCTWEAYNNQQISLLNGGELQLSKVSVTTKVYDISNNNHVKLTLQHLNNLKR